MEDHKQSRTQPAADEEETILDLTEDMALADQAEHKIFDLTDGVAIPEKHRPIEQPMSAPVSAAEGEIDQSAAATTDQQEIQKPESEPLILESEPGMPPDLPIDDAATASEMPAGSETAETSPSIEDEVGAAFDEVQSETSPTKESVEKGDQLFDKLSGITQMVDDAVRNINEDDASQHPASPSIDDATLASDAAELETAISGEEEDDEIIELTDIVDPSELAASQESINGDDDIIDLVDIVDPAELECLTPGNDSAAIDSEPVSSADLDQDALPEPESDPQPLDAPGQGEEELALADLESFDLNGDEEALSETDDQDEGVDRDDEEDVILLTDVLKKGDGAKVISLADKEADEETAGESMSGDDMASDTMGSAPLAPEAEAQDALSDSQIEAAVEHLLKTKYADTVRLMVSEAVEKAVAREVENMRRGLSDPDGS